jgi:hypothetical protein
MATKMVIILTGVHTRTRNSFPKGAKKEIMQHSKTIAINTNVWNRIRTPASTTNDGSLLDQYARLR